MNTSKQVNLMVGLLFLLVVAVAMYWIWDPIRAEEAQEQQTEKSAERGAELFATFCRTCHGNQGLGRLERNDLPGLPLNLTDNRPTKILELEQKQALFRDVTKCGRVGTLMPPWARDQGGALNDEQIRQMVILITTNAGNAWEKALEFANHADETGKSLVGDVSADAETITISDSKGLEKGGFIRLDEELLEIKEVEGNRLTVERGLRGTKAVDHAAGSAVYGPPIDPPTGPVNEQACGQIARGLPAATAPAPAGPPVSGTIAVEMGDNFFTFQGQRQPNIAVRATDEITVNLVNNGKAIHNLRIAGLDDKYDSKDDLASSPETMKAGDKGTLKFKLDKAGAFKFRCDFHPQEMIGTITVVQ